MFGINGGEFLVLLVVALLVIGPERLPGYAQQLGRFVREMRRMALGARSRMEEELGDEFTDVDWSRLDPRQYDPRRIVREALMEPIEDERPAKPRRPRSPAGASPAGGAKADGTTPDGRVDLTKAEGGRVDLLKADADADAADGWAQDEPEPVPFDAEAT